MPWCEDCAKYWAPSAMTTEGACPTCGRCLDAPAPSVPLTAKTVNLKELAGEDAKAPWHFKLLMVMLSLYFVWRIVDLFR